MPIDARGIEDLALDAMVTALEAYRDAQAAIDPGVTFRVVPGNFRAMQNVRVPTVSVALSMVRPESGSARTRTVDMTATYHLDLIANGRAASAAAGGARGDAAAYGRLLYLIQQVQNAIYASPRREDIEDTGLQIEWPNVQIVEPESFTEESPLVGARLTIEGRYEYVPAVGAGTDIDSVSVDAGRWSGLYEYDGG